MKINGIMPFGS